MKRVFLISVILMLISLVPSYSQLTKGSFLVGGSVSGGFNSYKYRSGNTTTTNQTEQYVSFMPQAGYFVIDNLAAGLGFNLSTDKVKQKYNGATQTSHEFSVAPFVRYYYKKFFAQGIVSFGSGSVKYNGIADQDNQTSKTSEFNLGVGYAAFLNKHIAVEPMFGYKVDNEKFNGTDPKIVTPGFYVRVGFQIYLHK